MRPDIIIVSFLLFSVHLFAQHYERYLGHGGIQGVTVTTSSDLQRPAWPDRPASGIHTIDGKGMDHAYMTTARLMKQATLGARKTDIHAAMPYIDDYEPWIDRQLSLPPTFMAEHLEEVFSIVNQTRLDAGADSSELAAQPDFAHFNYTWWANHHDHEDLLRQRVAYALSQILVISMDSDLWTHGRGVADYYDLLIHHAFGNYRDLLLDVSLHPTMGHYLSHLNNPRSIPQLNTTPDENYAREIMQLFSIGLYELNQDGTRRLDQDGQPIPTYDQTDITELAKVFTGLGLAALRDNMYYDEAEFGLDIFFSYLQEPMRMYEEWHEPGEKHILGGQVIPAGQTAMEDIEDAVDIIFHHPNVGPFIARRLIQHMVTSNPSPGYISRVAGVFNANGDGERGDMAAVIKAILLDSEARDCDQLDQPYHGKLVEPFLRFCQFARYIDKIDVNEYYWNIGYQFYEEVEQTPLAAPSVFSFFLPDHQPAGSIGEADMFGPEFQIHNERTAIAYMNLVNEQAVYQYLMYNWEEDIPAVFTDYEALLPLAQDTETLINELDKHLTHGRMTDETRDIIKSAVDQIEFGNVRLDRVRLAVYLTLISPDYSTLR